MWGCLGLVCCEAVHFMSCHLTGNSNTRPRLWEPNRAVPKHTPSLLGPTTGSFSLIWVQPSTFSQETNLEHTPCELSEAAKTLLRIPRSPLYLVPCLIGWTSAQLPLLSVREKGMLCSRILDNVPPWPHSAPFHHWTVSGHISEASLGQTSHGDLASFPNFPFLCQVSSEVCPAFE